MGYQYIVNKNFIKCIAIVSFIFFIAVGPIANAIPNPTDVPSYVSQQNAGNATVATDSLGNTYVPDISNNRIQIFNPDGTLKKYLGITSSTCDDIGSIPVLPGDNGKFCGPLAVALDHNDNIYVADAFNSRVQKFNSSGIYLSQFGTMSSGCDGYFNSTYVTPVDNGKFCWPTSITFDSQSNIYISDTANNRIQKFSSTGIYIAQFGTSRSHDCYPYGVISQPDTPEDNSKLCTPTGSAVDDSGNVYVADTNNNRVQKFNSSGIYLSQFGTASSNCVDLFGTVVGPLLNPEDNGKFCGPDHITIDSTGNIYVADSGNNRIQKFAYPKTTTTLPSAPPTTQGAPNIITLETSAATTVTCANTVSTSTIEKQDPGKAYPLGLVNFCLGAPQGSSQPITLTFTTDLKPSDVIARKYNPTTKDYGTVPGAIITETTQNGKHALQLTYSIVDGGPLDSDGVVNGTILDPVGLATTNNNGTGGLAETGENVQLILGFSTLIIITGVGVMVVRRK